MKKITLLLFFLNATFLFAQEQEKKAEELKEVQIVGSRNTKWRVVE